MSTVKGVEELVYQFTSRGNAIGFLSTMIAILYFATIYALETLGSSTMWKPWFRGLLADYAYPVSFPPSAYESNELLNTVSSDWDIILGRLRAYSWPFKGYEH